MMNEEILEAVKKSLPSMQVDLLKKELLQAGRVPGLESELATYRKNLADAQDVLATAKAACAELRSREVKLADLEKKERDLEVSRLKYELEAQRSHFSSMKEIVLAAFRNPTVYKNFNKTIPDPGANYQGATISVSGRESQSVE